MTTDGNATWRRAGYGVGAVGAALAIGGVVLAVTATGAANTARDRGTVAQLAGDRAGWQAAEADFSDARSRNTVGWVLVGAGVAALAGGAALVALNRPSADANSTASVAPWYTPGGGGLTARCTF